MRSVKTLIEDCVAMCGTQKALALKLNSTQQDVHKWMTGKRAVSPATVGQLCDLLGLDGDEARRLAAEAVIATAKPEKQGVLRRAFFVSASGQLSGEVLDESNGEKQTAALRVATVVIESAMSLHSASATRATACGLARTGLVRCTTL